MTPKSAWFTSRGIISGVEELVTSQNNLRRSFHSRNFFYKTHSSQRYLMTQSRDHNFIDGSDAFGGWPSLETVFSWILRFEEALAQRIVEISACELRHRIARQREQWPNKGSYGSRVKSRVTGLPCGERSRGEDEIEQKGQKLSCKSPSHEIRYNSNSISSSCGFCCFSSPLLPNGIQETHFKINFPVKQKSRVMLWVGKHCQGGMKWLQSVLLGETCFCHAFAWKTCPELKNQVRVAFPSKKVLKISWRMWSLQSLLVLIGN